MADTYKASYYNLVVGHGHYKLLFNGVTSGLMRLPPDIASDLEPFLGPPRSRAAGQGRSAWVAPSFRRKELPSRIQQLLPDLLRGRFFVKSDENELAHLKDRFEYFQQRDPFLVTITTTMDCNLGCYYCYEDKSKSYLSREGCDAILDWIKEQIRAKGHERLYTDWYGGEPMLNQEAIEYFSNQAIEYCDAEGVGYSSAMISNGTLWPDDAKGFVERARIRHVQFTFDGPRQHHDRRRRYVVADERSPSSFDEIVKTVDRVLRAARIYLRINVDPGSAPDVMSLVEFFKEHGWLERGVRIYPYLAMIGPMTEHCSFLGKSKRMRDFSAEFDTLNNEFQLAISRHIDPRGIQHLQYYPMTVKLNCAAVGANSVVFGPDGYMYKCGLDVGQHHLAHDQLPLANEVTPPVGLSGDLPTVRRAPGRNSAHPWDRYDPFSHERCSECQYLPICLGGCPKTHFEKNDFYLEQQSKYWESNIDTVLRTYHDTTAAHHASD